MKSVSLLEFLEEDGVQAGGDQVIQKSVGTVRMIADEIERASQIGDFKRVFEVAGYLQKLQASIQKSTRQHISSIKTGTKPPVGPQ